MSEKSGTFVPEQNMSALLKTCTRLAPSVRLHLLHDIRYSYITCASFNQIIHSNTDSNLNLYRSTKFQYSSRVDSSRKSPQQEEEEDSVEEETDIDEEDEDESDEELQAAEGDEEMEEDDEAGDSDEEMDEDKPKELSVNTFCPLYIIHKTRKMKINTLMRMILINHKQYENKIINLGITKISDSISQISRITIRS